ncbi:MAG: HAMP domain-containing protein, partial [Gammaproteobacteria bacterium]
MFSNIKISRRLILLIGVLTLIFIVTGALSLVGMNKVTAQTAILNLKTAEASDFTKISATVRHGLVDVGRELSSGALTWSEARDLLKHGLEDFNRLWQEQMSKIAGDSAQEEFFNDAFGIEVKLVRQGYEELLKIADSENRGHLSLYMLNDAPGYTAPFLNAAEALSSLESVEAQGTYENTVSDQQFYLIASALVIVTGLLLASILGPMVYFSITRPIGRISDVVSRVSEGDLEARTELKSRDELGQLATAFDNMLEERVSSMAKASKDNESLNNSVIELLEAVSELSNRDLTVAVPVAEDVTGPVADAMNLMARETARVLADIRSISNQVAEAASTVESQGGKINHLADAERKIIEDTMTKLNEASKTMNLIAKQAKASNEIAAKASSSTQQAFETVSKTAEGMNEIRETIAETEKRIKRLGERSQEINGIVEIINNIAERTH